MNDGHKLALFLQLDSVHKGKGGEIKGQFTFTVPSLFLLLLIGPRIRESHLGASLCTQR